MRDLSILPSGKYFRLKLTQPMYSDSVSCGSKPVPMMNSVEPPPMSITRRRCGGFRQRVRNAEVDQARFLAPGDHLDREAERGARLAQELRRVLRHAQRVGADHAHRRTREAAQALAELGERLERARLGGAIDALLGGQARAQAHHLAHRVEGIDLAVDHATDLQVEAVRAEVDRGERVVTRHAD